MNEQIFKYNTNTVIWGAVFSNDVLIVCSNLSGIETTTQTRKNTYLEDSRKFTQCNKNRQKKI